MAAAHFAPHRPKAVIIGAGIAGIAAAIRLAVKGYRAEVFEANAYAGGKFAEFSTDGYRFDAGPSLFTMPQYVDELFLLAGKDPRDYFNYHRLGNVCNYFYEDGTRISAWADEERFASEIEHHTTDSAAAVKKFLRNSRNIYDITHHVFLERSLHRAASWLRADTLRSLLRLPQIDPFRTMNQANEAFFNDSRTIRLFNRYATYNGSDPYRAPATLNIIPHLEHHFGAWFPDGGMYSIVRSLLRLALDLGVKFHYHTPVDEILVKNGRVAGIRTGAGIADAGLVLSNMDVWFTYQRLLKGQATPRRLFRQERSSSALIFYWGMENSFRETDLHNIFFSDDYREEFRYIWQERRICRDPTVYLNVSSKCHPGDAPPGCENWFVMINVPANIGQHWDALISTARTAIINKLNRNLGTDIRPYIRTEQVLDPRSIESQTSSWQGALYGPSSNSPFSAFLRHANFNSKIKGLYFAGGSVHPGGGIPLALQSAKIAVNGIPALFVNPGKIS